MIAPAEKKTSSSPSSSRSIAWSLRLLALLCLTVFALLWGGSGARAQSGVEISTLIRLDGSVIIGVIGELDAWDATVSGVDGLEVTDRWEIEVFHEGDRIAAASIDPCIDVCAMLTGTKNGTIVISGEFASGGELVEPVFSVTQECQLYRTIRFWRWTWKVKDGVGVLNDAGECVR